jgi:copper oxidase (laccase) domain-containing protein
MNVAEVEVVPDFADLGIRAFTTTRALGSFSTVTDDPVGQVMSRWRALRRVLGTGGPRFATASQVHGARVVMHSTAWDGWLRVDDADGHIATERGTAFAITIADCVPIFVAHPSGAIALLHSGWRGTAARIVESGISALASRGLAPTELRVHLGPSICGRWYEVSADVHRQLTGVDPGQPAAVDLRRVIAARARVFGDGGGAVGG